ncbi:MAG TPA: NAD(P)/FAD-dependent oxidoreductase [Pricia sp.]|nr:NAD(P)/FAD-dependent oxidoreductase [Pricia sp.]
MLNKSTIQYQYEQAAEDNLRILVVGAGIAGITAAQLLRKNGQHPVLIERDKDASHPGYMLALMPMVDAVVNDLNVREGYLKQSTALDRYGFHEHQGKSLRVDSMAEILSRYGDYRGIARGKLLEVLTNEGCDVAFDTTVTAISETSEISRVDFKTGTETCQLDFDLVIVADGIHSSTRELVLKKQKIDIVDTHWGGWVVWAPEDENMDLGEELWGAGFFFGVYPVKGKLGVFLGGSLKDTKIGPKAFVSKIRKKLDIISPRIESCLRSIEETDKPFYWPLKDCRSPQWAFNHTILLGDAAAGFLPTAGIGAGMAMESAWVLTRMLHYSNKENVATMLKAYEKLQRPRVESAQGNSRGLAWLMFHKSKILAYIRDWAMRLVSVEMALKPIQKLVANSPNPDGIAKSILNRESNNNQT